MDELTKEKKEGFDLFYLLKSVLVKLIIGKRYNTPGFGLAAQLFATFAKVVIEKLGEKQGEALIKEVVESYGRERGKRIAEIVKSKGKPLSFRNWLIYTDIAANNFQIKLPQIENNNLIANVGDCSFIKAAQKWDLGEYAKLYCKYADYAILDGYNPDIKLDLKTRHATGKDHCIFQYVMKESNQ